MTDSPTPDSSEAPALSAEEVAARLAASHPTMTQYAERDFRNHAFVPGDGEHCGKCRLETDHDIHTCSYSACHERIPYFSGRGQPLRYCTKRGSDERRWEEHSGATCRDLHAREQAEQRADPDVAVTQAAYQQALEQFHTGIDAAAARITAAAAEVLAAGDDVGEATDARIADADAAVAQALRGQREAEARATAAEVAQAAAEHAADQARAGQREAEARMREAVQSKKEEVAEAVSRAVEAERRIAAAQRGERDANAAMAEAHEMRETAVAEARGEVEAGLARETALQHDITRLTTELDAAQSQISVAEERAEAAITKAREDAAAAVAEARQREETADQRAREAAGAREAALEGKASAEAEAAVAEARTGEIRTQLRVTQRQLDNSHGALELARSQIRQLESVLRDAAIDPDANDDDASLPTSSDSGDIHDQ